MMRKTGIGLLLLGALVLSVGWITATAGAEETPQTVLPSELPPLPAVPAPSGEPVGVQGAVEGTVESASGTVTEAAKTVADGGAPPKAPSGETGPPPGGHERGGTVGEVVAGTTEAAGNTAASVEGAVKSATGTASPSAPPDTGPSATEQSGTEAPAPVTQTTAPAPTGSPSVAATANDRSTSGSSQRDPGRRHHAVPSPVDDSAAELQKIADAVDPSAAARAALAGVVRTVAEGADGALGALPASSSQTIRSGSDPIEADPGKSSGSSFHLSDLTPHSALGTLAFLLVLGAGALAVTMVVRRELGLGFLPGRRLRG